MNQEAKNHKKKKNKHVERKKRAEVVGEQGAGGRRKEKHRQ